MNYPTYIREAGPRIVCLCGSTRFRDEFAVANRQQTLAGRIVLAPGVFGHSGDSLTEDDKARLDELHLRKIDLAHSVLVVNPGGYIGESTRREIEYARRTGKPVAFMYDANGEPREPCRRHDEEGFPILIVDTGATDLTPDADEVPA
ncbi:hypothetical protein [Actinopolymorpha alba]|uniref:hypothetical protein n=1 Tax=Actinopolymorpha alba TaxID=533267 RepID=UPI00037D6778|nr:hypothetical protein [Actinopolymorpha alba]